MYPIINIINIEIPLYPVDVGHSVESRENSILSLHLFSLSMFISLLVSYFSTWYQSTKTHTNPFQPFSFFASATLSQKHI
jgi:hypothetical protein